MIDPARSTASSAPRSTRTPVGRPPRGAHPRDATADRRARRSGGGRAQRHRGVRRGLPPRRPAIRVELLVGDGDGFAPGDALAVDGPARGILPPSGSASTSYSGCPASLRSRHGVRRRGGARAPIADTPQDDAGVQPRATGRCATAAAATTAARSPTTVMAKDNHLAVLAAGGQDLVTER